MLASSRISWVAWFSAVTCTTSLNIELSVFSAYKPERDTELSLLVHANLNIMLFSVRANLNIELSVLVRANLYIELSVLVRANLNIELFSVRANLNIELSVFSTCKPEH